jgi:acid stress-induced BolA-like protein IbaG/YrbA
MVMDIAQIKTAIEAGLPQCEAWVTGDGTHFEAVVICDAFDGKRMLEQHKMVYGALGDAMRTSIHALSIRTFTRREWAQQGNAPHT